MFNLYHTPYISQVVLFNEDAGDEQDPEDDPWIPDPENCPDPYNPNCPCHVGPCARTAGGDKVDLREDLVKKTTKYLLDSGVNLVELYNEAMKLTGHEEEMIDTDAAGRTKSSHRYYPAGRIMVRDNSINQDVPVKGTYIKSRRFFKLDHTYTNANGNFNISKGYRNKAQVLVKFKNGWAKVRGVNGGLKIWQWTHPVKVKLGLFEKHAMENITRTFQYTANADTRQAMQFTAAHTINTVFDINQYCAANNINTIPNNINLWVTTSNWFRSSTAPMLNKVTDPLQAQLFLSSFLVPPLSPGSIAQKALAILLNYAPDVVITINNDSQNGPARVAEDISRTAFHELGHAVHYNKVGRSYWLDIIVRYIANKAVNDGYGNKTSTGSGLVAVVESWGFFIGNTFNAAKYSAVPLITNRERTQLENNIPVDNIPIARWDTGSQGWIPIGFPHDLIDTGEPTTTGVIDNVNGYTINGIFKGYNTNATTVQSLKTQILGNNGNSQAVNVNTMVTSYRY